MRLRPSEALFSNVCNKAVASCPGQGSHLGPCLKGHHLLWRAVSSHGPDGAASVHLSSVLLLGASPLVGLLWGSRRLLGGAAGFLPELHVESTSALQKEDGESEMWCLRTRRSLHN